MIRHILFWNYTDTVKNQHREAEALQFLQDSVATMNGHIDGLLKAEIGQILPVDTDLVFYAELEDTDALKHSGIIRFTPHTGKDARIS